MQDGEDALSLLTGRGSAGHEFFETAARALTMGLGCRWAGVGQLMGDGGSVQLLALWDGGKKGGLFAYDLAGAPCEKVIRPDAGQPHWFFSDKLGEAFPDTLLLKKTGAVSYRGEAFCDDAGAPLGHVFALSEKAEGDDPQTRAFLRVVSDDVGIEFARWRAEETLRESEAALAKAQQMAKIGHWRWSIAGDRFLSCSPEYENIHGVDPRASQDYMSDMMAHLVHPDDRDRVAETFMRLEDEAAAYEIEYRILHPGGETRHVLALGEAVCDASEQPVEHIGTVQDITGRRAGGESSPGAEANGAAPEASLTKAKSSHDFRTPLNVIVGFSEIISGEMFGPVGNEKYRKYARDIYEAGLHMLDLVSDESEPAELAPGGDDDAMKKDSKFPESYDSFEPL